ncbi:metal-dependent hydrolase [Mycobacterium sp. 29Ha]|uniref:metal-dependent hydrolase n=1 Tax=Mycobacterium sp. 29Ha TaxID=2939268 RepID=UPI00293ABB7D|nr:metal-dependent hydrolase [Mycobacterium sp. 29Ha]
MSVAVGDATGWGSRYPKTRQIRFRFGEHDGYGKYFVNDDIVFSHFAAGLSGAFPPGEESFTGSVRRVGDHITDPGLKNRVARFIGQESMHGPQYRQVNDKLIEMGHPVAWWDGKRPRDRQRELFGVDGALVGHLK